MFSIASSGAVFTKLAAVANHALPKPRHGPRPTDPLRDHRRRHLGIRRQQRPNPRLSHADRRLHRRPPMLRWPIAGQCSPTVSRATPSCLTIARCDSFSLRCRCRINRPVFQGDHTANLIGWPTFQPGGFQPVTTGLVFNRRQHEVSVGSTHRSPCSGPLRPAANTTNTRNCRCRLFILNPLQSKTYGVAPKTSGQ
jgi:hypothetical protein